MRPTGPVRAQPDGAGPAKVRCDTDSKIAEPSQAAPETEQNQRTQPSFANIWSIIG